MPEIKDLRLPTMALFIGAVAIAIAIIRRIEVKEFKVQLSTLQSILLGIFGGVLIIVGIVGYFAPPQPIVGYFASPQPSDIPMPVATVTLELSLSPTVISTSTLTPPATITPTSTSTLASTPTPSPTVTPTPTPTPCTCQSATVDETLRCLIHAESEAANRDDLTLIQQIFAPDATIRRGDTEQEWHSPMTYYGPAFASLNFTDARHFDIELIKVTDQIVRYTSGSSGSYATPNATPTPYYNKNPSEHWTFGKNDAGCWVILEFEFNASHIPFP